MEGYISSSYARERIPTVVLALEAPRGASRGASQGAPRGAHAHNVGVRSNASTDGLDEKHYITSIVTINTGEDICEKIQTYFRQRENISSHYLHQECMGMILATTGSIFSPIININGSAVTYEGSYVLVRASGLYSLDRGGQVQQSGNFLITFADSDGAMFGGSVVGPLIAATRVQVTLGSFINDENNEVMNSKDQI